MRTSWILLLICLQAVGWAQAARTSASYAVPAEGLDAGGGRSSSGVYSQTSSLDMVAGSSNATSPNTLSQSGLIAQFQDESPTATPVVNVLGLTKTRFYDQIAPTTLTANNFSMSAFIEGNDLNSTFPSGSNRFLPAGGGTTFLSFDSDMAGWFHESFHASQTALDTAFPNGDYSFLVGAFPEVPLSFPTNNYPVAPVIGTTAGTWSGGRLLLTTAQAVAGFQLSSNVSNGNGFLTLEVFSDNTDVLYEEITENPASTEFLDVNVPAGSLAVGITYTVEAEFDHVVSNPMISQAWAAPLARGYALFSSRTTFAIQVITPQQGWRQQYFGTTDNSGNAADGFDHDHDGLVNLLEWACGLNPTIGSTLPTPAMVNGANIEFTYPRSVAAMDAGAIFTVEWSDTLALPSWSSSSVVQSILSDNGTTQQVKATLPKGGGSKRFVRLSVAPPP